MTMGEEGKKMEGEKKGWQSREAMSGDICLPTEQFDQGGEGWLLPAGS